MTPPTSPQAGAPATGADPVVRLEAAFRAAFEQVLGPEHAAADPVLRPAGKPEFGDFQANAAMALAKRVGTNPRELATKLVGALDAGDLIASADVAGPGFINLRLRPEALASLLDEMDTPALGVVPSTDTHSVVIDLCSVNVAKQMHVGHLRSCIIGDALARTFERLGRTVHRENHLGDWGLPIAQVLHQLRESGADLDALTLSDLDAAYKDAKLAAKADVRGLEAARRLGAGPHRLAELEAQNASAADVLEGAKRTLVGLQQGDAELEAQWHRLIDVTLAALFEAVEIMNVKLGPEHNRGESWYRDRLGPTVEAAIETGVAEEDDGALVIRFDDRDRPVLIRKSDGGFLYATTDVAALRFRTQELNADRIVYVVDARQRDHFRDVFDAVRRLGWHRCPDGTEAEMVHIGFGSVLGEDRKPLKTRSGVNVTLRSLLDEAVERGVEQVRARATDPHAPTHGLKATELDDIGRAVGIGAVKYADLSNDLVRDYVFDFDRMIAFEGDTGPYLQYAHARLCSIERKAGEEALAEAAGAELVVAEPAERALALRLLQYPGVVQGVADTLEPHRLCTYLLELASDFSAFYQQCPVLKGDGPTRAARLRLCGLVKRTLADGLELLGIERPERM